MVCEHLDIWDGVVYPGEFWGDCDTETEFQPFSPGGGTGPGPARADAVAVLLLCSAEVIL